MKKIIILLALYLFVSCQTSTDPVPESWKTEWNAPSADMRPLQIIHDGMLKSVVMGTMLFDKPMSYYKNECGLGGIVCNVSLNDYLYNEDEWKRFIDVVKDAREVGLRVWIYDEYRYPSLAAGGAVLHGHPELESLALVYDAQRKDEPFYTRPAYEFTHASNNYAVLRRYPNPLNLDATSRFIEVTHEQYRDRLGPELFSQIEAFFTDEPSLNTVVLGQIPESARTKVPMQDQIDPDIRPLPMVPWCDDLPQRYQEKYGEDLMPHRRSLFIGDSEEDKEVRQKFWGLVTELYRDRYYARIQDWCREHNSSVPTSKNPEVPLRVASSGHLLWEENTYAHVPLDGNALELLMKMDVPGMDMLDSNPQSALGYGWRAAVYPSSAAYWTGRRLAMTEISDFTQQQQNNGQIVDLKTMCATAAWQAAWGITEFTLYYKIEGRGEEIYKKYCDYVGRLNAVLRTAEVAPEAVLYYPIKELQAEYTPQATSIDLNKMSPETKRLIGDFHKAGTLMVKNQIPFVISDKLLTASETGGKPFLKNYEDAMSMVASDNMPGLVPQSEWIISGRFKRDGRDIFLLLNTADTPYQGALKLPAGNASKKWCFMNPADGGVTDIALSRVGDTDTIPFQLEPMQTILVVGSK